MAQIILDIASNLETGSWTRAISSPCSMASIGKEATDAMPNVEKCYCSTVQGNESPCSLEVFLLLALFLLEAETSKSQRMPACRCTVNPD